MSCNQFPALFANQNVLEFRSSVNGDDDYKFNFEYELDKPYHIEICQSEEAGNVTFNILIDGQIVHSTINTDPGAILIFIVSSKLETRPRRPHPGESLPREGPAPGRPAPEGQLFLIYYF